MVEIGLYKQLDVIMKSRALASLEREIVQKVYWNPAPMHLGSNKLLD